MKHQALVSIISPCYNGEKYVSYFLESVLSQTYSNVELWLIDDGSTDRTREIIGPFVERFLNRGYQLHYIYQKNAGQAAAINQGLKRFSGEYLMWVDSDDILLPENIEKKVDFLEKNPEYGFVQCLAEMVHEDAPEVPIQTLGRRKPAGEDNLFEDLIYERNVCYGPGVIMARGESIKSSIPSMEIYESRQGQNWQLMLPLAHMYRCGYIEEILFRVVAHDDSHSRTRRTYQQQIERNKGFIELLTNTIDNLVDMDIAEKKKWVDRINIKYQRRILEISYQNRDRRTLRQAKRVLRCCGYDYRQELRYLINTRAYSTRWGKLIYRIIHIFNMDRVKG